MNQCANSSTLVVRVMGPTVGIPLHYPLQFTQLRWIPLLCISLLLCIPLLCIPLLCVLLLCISLHYGFHYSIPYSGVHYAVALYPGSDIKYGGHKGPRTWYPPFAHAPRITRFCILHAESALMTSSFCCPHFLHLPRSLVDLGLGLSRKSITDSRWFVSVSACPHLAWFVTGSGQ